MTAPPNAWPVPDGFVIVPREPTPAMLDHPTVMRHLFNRWQTMLVWDAMLASAPAPPVPQAKDVPPAPPGFLYDTGERI
jgi:hypothetical protein